MGEPWLDSLSEDWNSEPRLSSPASSLASSKNGTQNSRSSSSRIPHLAHNMRHSSTGSSFLKPRSSRGIAKSKGFPILSERSASSLNLQNNSQQDGSLKRLASATVPRKPSSNFSDSQQSVQHHTIDPTSKETPEWKRRIQNGEDIASDGFDLFSPSKLEGMFSQPAQSDPDQENQSSLIINDHKPWTSLKASNLQQPTDQYQSFRTSRSRAPRMEALLEINEEEDEESREHSLSAISSEVARNASLRGLVRRRVSDLEQPQDGFKSRQEDGRAPSYSKGDPRWRTISGQQEIQNEVISPVTASTKNTISARALRESVELNPELLKKKLMEASSDNQGRPSSRSSDRDVSYNGGGLRDDYLLHEEILEDMTSHSLPEDLSMGTQDFSSHSGYVNFRRGAASTEPSFLKKKLSSVPESSQIIERPTNFRSSPPPYNTNKSFADQSESHYTFAGDSDEGSVVHHEKSGQQRVSAGSPLKLFGNRDTYTNNKLLRVLSQYEQDGSDHSSGSEMQAEEQQQQQRRKSEPALRMSQFGRGELDTFNFEKEVDRPRPTEAPMRVASEKIFQSLADLTIDDQGTIPGARLSAQDAMTLDEDESNTKRIPSSPAKDRSSKRRRTLLRDEIVVEGVDIEIKVDQVQQKISTKGKKRKDATPGEGGVPAGPEVLASRSILQPKSGSRRSSGESQPRSTSQDSTIKRANAPTQVTEALAAELASFVQEYQQVHNDSRKPSLATKDYMEEANKVMEFIRARGKPKPQLAEIPEPTDVSELDADGILDLEVEDESTIEPFSRPPSREGPVRPREDPRIAKHDPRIASHLRRFQDSDDLELLASTSVAGTLHLVDNKAASEAALVPVPLGEQESSPPNMRILNDNDTQRKRKHSASTNNDQVNSAPRSGSSSRRTFATDSSSSSGNKGMITSGKVSIPDTVGTMTFDHEKQIWVKQQLAKMLRKESQGQQVQSEKRDEPTIEDDPFDSIPDLSIDEQHEAAMRVVPKATSSSRPSTAETVQVLHVSRSLSEADRVQSLEEDQRSELSDQDEAEAQQEINSQPSASLHSEASKHEERLHQGIASTEPIAPGTPTMQPRVVTIAFSSPVASEIPRPVVRYTTEVFDDDDDDFLPPEDSEDDTDYLRTPKATLSQSVSHQAQPKRSTSTGSTKQQRHSDTLERRPVSRIEERDEEAEEDVGMSLVHIKEPQTETPAPAKSNTVGQPISAYKGTSMLCLTPLSEFTMHQADKVNHPEESFVQARAHPKALLQAHGALALSVDTLVKAITDAIPEEPFWEQLRMLDLKSSRLQSVHGLQDYCAGLEILDLSDNQVAQLDGLPPSLRNLNISRNLVNDFTSWSKLRNLQYVDVSNNQLENLECFSSLVHVRRLKCRDNQIRDIEGVLDLDGLISIDLHANHLVELDFEGVDMPRLEELTLSNNRLTSVRNLHCLPQLRRLDLSGNSLRDFRMSQPLLKLERLAVSENELDTIDLTMFPSLTELELDGNCIRTIEGLSTARQLRKLSLRGQRESLRIAEIVLTTPNECSEIYLSSNVIAGGELKLPRYPHYNLRHLEIAACGLRCLPIGFGDYFPNCRNLNLNFNAISEVSPLLGIIKIREIMIAGNRIKRLRRTCLTFSRLPLLEKIDIRNNPLTVGFYAPDHGEKTDSGTFTLPNRSATQDTRWLQLLDEVTGFKRKMVELLLLEGCKSLKDLDGLPFNKEQVQERDVIWDKLTSNGVLMKMIEAPPTQIHPQSPSPIEMPVDHSLQPKQYPVDQTGDQIAYATNSAQRRSLAVV